MRRNRYSLMRSEENMINWAKFLMEDNMIENQTHGTARPRRLKMMLLEHRDCIYLTCFIQHMRWHHKEVKTTFRLL